MVLLSEWHVLTVFEDSTKQEDSVSSAHPKQAHVSDLHMHSTRELDLFLQSHDSKLIRHPAQILRSSLLRRETYCFNMFSFSFLSFASQTKLVHTIYDLISSTELKDQVTFSVHMFFLSACLSVCLPVCLSVCLSVEILHLQLLLRYHWANFH